MKKLLVSVFAAGLVCSAAAQEISASSGRKLMPMEVLDTTVVDTMALDTMALDTMALDTMALDTMALDTVVVDTMVQSTMAEYVPNADNTISVKHKYHTYTVANQDDVSHIYRRTGVNKQKCFFVISKQEYRLYVYEVVGKDTVLNASFPVCYAKMKGPKTKTGDMSTPECSLSHPARISEIKDASSWCHDFKDGRGSIRAYGHWFMRLDLTQSDCHSGCRSNKSIGIHGSTNNNASVPGRDSEGCIRLRDADLNLLHDLYACVGVRVVIKPADMGKQPFEVRAEKACQGYVAPTQGYKEH